MRLPEFNPVALKELRQLVRTKVITWGLVLHPALLLVAASLWAYFKNRKK